MPNVSQINADNTLYDVKDAFMRSITPEAATTQNKLSTAADVAEKNISGSATGTAITLTDSADARVQGLTIYGRSEVVEGEIKSVGDNGLTVTTANSDNTVTTSADFTTALPLRGVSDTVRDKLTCTSDKKKVETVCGALDLGTIIWTKYEQTEDYDRYISADIDTKAKDRSATLCAKYETYNPQSPITANKIWIGAGRAKLSVTTSPNEYPDAAAFKTAMSGVMLIYELAEPVTTPLTSAEISAFRGLKTYDSATNVMIDNGIVVYSPLFDSNNKIITDSQYNGLIGVSK